MSERVIIHTVSEFRGDFPTVPIAPAVELDALTAGDPEPMFVTLPVVPEVDSVSASGLIYDAELVASIESQVNAKRPGANFGHMTKEEQAVKFPHPEAFWVGARRVANTLWAKAYVPAGPGREHLRRLKALNAAISTSIFGMGEFVDAGEGMERLRNFEMETIDFAPPERAALGYSAPLLVTAQMDTGEQDMGNESNTDPKPTPARDPVVQLRDVPDAVRAQIIAEHEAQTGDKRKVAELEQDIEAREAREAELETQIKTLRVAEFRRTLNGRIVEATAWGNESRNREHVEALRRTLRDRVQQSLGESADLSKLDAAIERTFAELGPVIEAVRDKLAGPPAVVNGKVRGRRELEDTPEARARARSQFAF